MAIFRREPPNRGRRMQVGRLKSRNQYGLAINNCCTVVVFRTLRPAFCLRRLLDDQAWSTRCCVPCEIDQARSCATHSHGWPWIVCMTARLDVTPKTTEQNRIVSTGKSEAEVTNNKKNCAWSIVLLKLTTVSDTKHRAASLRQQSYLLLFLTVATKLYKKLSCCREAARCSVS